MAVKTPVNQDDDQEQDIDPRFQDPIYEDTDYVDKGVSELEDYANDKNNHKAPKNDNKDKNPGDKLTGINNLGQAEKNPDKAPKNNDDLVAREHGHTPELPGVNYNPNKKGAGGPKGPSFAKSPVQFLMSHKRGLFGGFGGGIIVIILFVLFIEFPLLALDHANNSKDHSKNRARGKSMSKKGQQRMQKGYARLLADDVQACGTLANEKCINAREDARKKNPNFDWPTEPDGSAMKAMNNGHKYSSALRESGFHISHQGGRLRIATPDGKIHNVGKADFADGRWSQELDQSMRATDFQVGQRTFRGFFRERILAKAMQSKLGAKLCSLFCKPEELKDEVREAAKKDPANAQEIERRKIGNALVADLDTRLSTRKMLVRFFDCLIQARKCNKNDQAREAADDIKNDKINELSEVDKGFKEKESLGHDLNDPTTEPGRLRRLGNVLDKVDPTSQLFKMIESKTGVPLIGEMVMIITIYDVLEQISSAALDPDNKAWTIIRVAFMSMLSSQAYNFMSTITSEDKSVSENNYRSEAAIAAIGAGGPLEDWAADNKLYQNLDGSEVNSKPEGNLLEKEFRMDTPPAAKEFLEQIPGGKYAQIALFLQSKDPLTQLAIKGVRLFNWTFGKIYDFRKKHDPLRCFSPDGAILCPIEKLLETTWKLLGPLLKPFINDAVVAILQMPGFGVDDFYGSALWKMAYVGGDYMAYLQNQDNGGKQLTPAEAKVSLRQIQEEERLARSTMPLKERLFSLDDTNSLLSKVLFESPIGNPSSTKSLVAAINPFHILASTLSSLSPVHAVSLDDLTAKEITGTPDVGLTANSACPKIDVWSKDKPKPEDDRKKDGLNDLGDDKVTEEDCGSFIKSSADLTKAVYGDQPVIGQ